MNANAAVVSDDSIIIKQEPTDDAEQNSSIQQAPAMTASGQDSLFVDTNMPDIQRGRIRQVDGEPFPTVCFESSHIDHPHHHHLICGHDVLTDAVVACGRNCMPSKTAASKAKGAPFACPFLRCPQQASPLREFDSKAGRFKPGRKCKPSHVYGRSAEKDKERLEEKARGGTATRGKRSPSPEAGQLIRKPKQIVDPAELLNQQLSEGTAEAREAILAIKGGTRAAVNGRFETEKDRLSRVREGKITKSSTARTPKRKPKEQGQQSHKKMCSIPFNFTETYSQDEQATSEASISDTRGRDLNVRCRSCMQKIFDVRHHCFHCAEDFDVCSSCYSSRNFKHTKNHRIKALQRPKIGVATELAQYQDVQTVCCCETTYDDFLVLCQDCNNEFHPGCLGDGRYGLAVYEDKSVQRGKALRFDWLRWKEGSAYRCLQCQEANEEAKEKMEKLAEEERELRVKALNAARTRQSREQKPQASAGVKKPMSNQRQTGLARTSSMKNLFQDKIPMLASRPVGMSKAASTMNLLHNAPAMDTSNAQDDASYLAAPSGSTQQTNSHRKNPNPRILRAPTMASIPEGQPQGLERSDRQSGAHELAKPSFRMSLTHRPAPGSNPRVRHT